MRDGISYRTSKDAQRSKVKRHSDHDADVGRKTGFQHLNSFGAAVRFTVMVIMLCVSTE